MHSQHTSVLEEAEAEYERQKSELNLVLAEHKGSAADTSAQLDEVHAHLARLEAAHETEVHELKAANHELEERLKMIEKEHGRSTPSRHHAIPQFHDSAKPTTPQHLHNRE